MSSSSFFNMYHSDVRDLSWGAAALLMQFCARARYNGAFRAAGMDHVLQKGQFVFGSAEIAKSARVDPKTIDRWVKELVKCGHIVVERMPHKGTIGTICNLSRIIHVRENGAVNTPLERVSNSQCHNRHINTVLRPDPLLAEDPIPVQDQEQEASAPHHVTIVAYLNERTGSKFSSETAVTKRLILARLKEGHTVDQFVDVIDSKADEWLDDEKWSKYLSPDTLFNQKNFEKYLNAIARGPTKDEEDAEELLKTVLERGRAERAARGSNV